jgi:hypothetical protein
MNIMFFKTHLLPKIEIPDNFNYNPLKNKTPKINDFKGLLVPPVPYVLHNFTIFYRIWVL